MFLPFNRLAKLPTRPEQDASRYRLITIYIIKPFGKDKALVETKLVWVLKEECVAGYNSKIRRKNFIC